MHAILAVIQAAVQAEAAFQQANAGLKTSPPIAARAKPRLGFMSLAGWGTRTRLGDSHMFDAFVNSIGFAFGRKDFAVSSEQMGRAAKVLSVMVEARAELVGIRRVTGQDGIATDDAALHFIEPDDAAKLDALAKFPFTDNGR